MSVIVLHKPKLLPLLCDGLNITIPIPSQAMQKHIITMMKYHDAKGSKHYEYYLQIPINGKSIEHLNYVDDVTNYLRVWVSPRQTAHNFMKIEINPSKADMILVPDAFGSLVEPHTSYQQLLGKAKVTRIDLSVDAQHLDINNTVFYSVHKTKSEILKYYLIQGKSGQHEKLGASTGDSQWIIYDKRAELAGKDKIIASPLTRIEYRYTPKNLMLEDLPNIPNPFKTLQVYKLLPQHHDDKVLRAIIKLTRHEGLTLALRGMTDNKYERAKYLKRIRACYSADWWKPNVVWEDINTVCSDLMQHDTMIDINCKYNQYIINQNLTN